jgi:hypothetical protein
VNGGFAEGLVEGLTGMDLGEINECRGYEKIREKNGRERHIA